MSYALDVYDVDNSTHLGTLAGAYDEWFIDDLLSLPQFGLTVDVASSADVALLQPRRVVRFRSGVSAGSGDVKAFIIQDRPSRLDADIEPETGETIAVMDVLGPDLLGWLGYSEGGMILEPYQGTDGRMQNPRMFGPFAADFDDSGWSAPTVAGPLTTDGWPDDQARAFEFTNKAIIRRTTSAADTDAPARMYVVADWRTRVVVYRNGDELFEKPAGETGLFFKDVEFDGDSDTIVLDCERNQDGTGRVGFTWLKLEETTDDDGNETFELGSVLRRSFDPADFPDADGDWKALEDYTNLPGVNVGYVMDVALTEMSDDSHSPMPTWDFDGDGDSDSESWEQEFARGFRLQELGLLLDELTSIEGEPEMTPSGVFHLYKRRGQDRTATVTVSTPFSLRLSGRGPQSTRWLYETQSGMGRATNAAAEAELGVQMRQFVQLGTDISPEGISGALVRQLSEDGQVRDEVEVVLPDDVEPYVDVFPGDTVMCDGRDGSESVRITSFHYERVRETGDVVWTATAVPYSEAA